MATKLARHGTEAGYKSEIKQGKSCERCKNAHIVYNRQFTKKGKAAGLQYGSHDALDHLYKSGPQSAALGRSGSGQGRAQAGAPPMAPGTPETDATGTGGSGSDAGDQSRPSMAERLRSGLFGGNSADFVESDEGHPYITETDPDPEPQGEDWARVGNDDDFVINDAGMRAIEDNMGTYLSIVGMTLEMVDPYCGSIAADNFDNMISKWAKVVAHYPSAAKLFLDGKGGIVFTWIAAIQATWPLLYAIFEHHLARTVELRDGIAYRRTQNGQSPVDATMPPAPDTYNYSVG